MLTIEGNIVNIDGVKRGRVEIADDGLISSVGLPTGKADIVLKDELIFPGFLDLHVHARECADHSWDYKEDFISAGEAAINGGVVAFADMPNNPVPPIDDLSYETKQELTKKTPVDVLLYAGTNLSSNPLKKKVPYKAYISKSVGDLFFDSFAELENFAKKYQGQNVSFHCEDPDILKEKAGESAHELKRPENAEVSAVDMALAMIEKYNLTGKICHASTVEGVEKIKKARARGIKVSVEVTPHHLYFDQTMFEPEKKGIFQVNPPIRQHPETKKYMQEALRKGDIDFLATDHAPHSLEEKQKGTSGLTHLDTFGSFTTWLMKDCGFTPQDILRVSAFNPAQFFNQYSSVKYGEIAKGFAGSLTVIDMNKPITITKSMLKTKAQWSPFEGLEFPGSVAYTIVKGKVYQVSGI